MTELKVRRVHPDATLPTRTHAGDAGYDLRRQATTWSGRAHVARDRHRAAARHAGLVLPRSGTALRHGISSSTPPGLIGEGYRGELKVLLLNTDRREPFTVAPGDRIAQLVIIAPALPAVVEVQELDDTDRGDGGFGSSGR